MTRVHSTSQRPALSGAVSVLISAGFPQRSSSVPLECQLLLFLSSSGFVLASPQITLGLFLINAETDGNTGADRISSCIRASSPEETVVEEREKQRNTSEGKIKTHHTPHCFRHSRCSRSRTNRVLNPHRNPETLDLKKTFPGSDQPVESVYTW